MNRVFINVFINLLPVIAAALFAESLCAKSLYNGVPWYDDRDSVVNAHGVGIIRDHGRYYMFGEAKTDSANVFGGFSCYSSDNLVDWTFVRIALPMQKDGRLGPDRIGERPKVVRCAQTNEYIMLAHSDDRGYKDPCVVYATSPTADGVYTYQGPLLYRGEPIRKWDIGAFTDDDGRCYLLVHHGEIYRLSDDCHAIDSCMVKDVKDIGESPAMMKKDGVYYWLSSHTTSWERNDNMYSTATSLSGPWTSRGGFCPEGTLTHNSQCSFVLPVGEGFVYMGDRWSYPCQRSSATQVWLPITVEQGMLSIPLYLETWSAQDGKNAEIALKDSARIDWQSDTPGSSTAADGITMKMKLRKGERIAIRGTTGDDGGYARVSIIDKKGRVRHSQLIDFYSKTPQSGLRYVSPKLRKGEYSVVVEVTGMKSNWSDKKRNVYGTHGTWVRISDVGVLPRGKHK